MYQAFKLGHFVNDYRLLGEAIASCGSEPSPVALSKVGKALCSFLFTSFMNVNWFIKSGLLKWDKTYWSGKQNLVRIWVAVYSFYPAWVAHSKAVARACAKGGDDDTGSASRSNAIFEAKLELLKAIMDFITFVFLSYKWRLSVVDYSLVVYFLFVCSHMGVFRYARATGYDLMLFRAQLPEELPAAAGIIASFLGVRSIWNKTK